ncbi:protein of unknown function [Hyphomicrobium sp. 1Nfss2.1]
MARSVPPAAPPEPQGSPRPPSRSVPPPTPLPGPETKTRPPAGASDRVEFASVQPSPSHRTWEAGAGRPSSPRRQHHNHLAAFQARLRFHLGNRFQVALHALQHLHAELLVGHLTTAEAQGDLHLVAVLEEPFDRAHLHVVVVVVDRGAHLDLFDLDDLLVLARLGRLLLRLVLVLAEVEDLADRWRRLRRNLDEIQARLHGALQCISVADHTYVLAILIDQSYFAGPDCLIDPGSGWLALGRGSHWSADVVSPTVTSLVSRALKASGPPWANRHKCSSQWARNIEKKRLQVKMAT